LQKITVKEIRGPLGKGDKKFYVVVDEKGAEFTTFDTKIAKVTPGSIIEADVKVEGKYVNIAEWKVLEDAPASLPGSGKTPEQFDAERRSIEAQVAFKGIIQLIEQEAIQKTDFVPGDLKTSVYDWARARLGKAAPMQASQKETKVGTTRAAIDNEHFENVGQLLTACSKEFGMNRAAVLAEANVNDPKEIKDLDALWKQIKALRKE